MFISVDMILVINFIVIKIVGVVMKCDVLCLLKIICVVMLIINIVNIVCSKLVGIRFVICVLVIVLNVIFVLY